MIRLVNKTRFFTFLAVVVMTIAFVIVVAYATNDNTNIVGYNTYMVQQGDTLWDIAESINDGSMDTREIIYDIREASNLDTADIQVCDVLQIPIYEED